MNKQPSFYRARFGAFAKAISYELSLPESKEGRMRIAYLRNGMEPEKYLLKDSYEFNIGSGLYRSIYAYMVENERFENKEPLTELEIHTLDTYFVLHPEKVCGVQTCATGYSFPIKTIGGIEDVKSAIDKTLNGKLNTEDFIKNETNKIVQYVKDLRFIKSFKDLENNEIVFVDKTPLIYSKATNTLFTANRSRQPTKFKVSSIRKATEADQEAVNKAIEVAVAESYWAQHPQYKPSAPTEQNFTTEMQKVIVAKINEINKPASVKKVSTQGAGKYFCCSMAEDGYVKTFQPHAKKIVLEGFENFEFFIHKGIYKADNLLKDESYWSITEATTGVSLVTTRQYIKTQKEAIAKAIDAINRNGGKAGLGKALADPKNNPCSIVQKTAPNKLTLYKYKAKALLIKLKLQNDQLIKI